MQLTMLIRKIKSIARWFTEALKPPSRPIKFPVSGFETIPPSETLEEEGFEQFQKGNYYPANIGEVLNFQYQIVGKLGFGTTSTVWLAHDLK